MTWPTVEPLRDQDDLSAAILNSKLADVRAAVNDIMPGAVQDNALRFAHMASILPSVGVQRALEGLTAGVHTYTNTYPGYNTSTVVGTGAGGGAGWRVISDGTTALSATWSSLTLGMNQATRVAGILVLADIEVQEINTGAAAVAANRNHCAAFSICWRNGAGTRTVLAHTERFEGAQLDGSSNAYAPIWKSVSIATLLDPNTASGATTGVDALVAFHDPTAGAPASPQVLLRRGRLIAIPLHARDTV